MITWLALAMLCVTDCYAGSATSSVQQSARPTDPEPASRLSPAEIQKQNEEYEIASFSNEDYSDRDRYFRAAEERRAVRYFDASKRWLKKFVQVCEIEAMADQDPTIRVDDDAFMYSWLCSQQFYAGRKLGRNSSVAMVQAVDTAISLIMEDVDELSLSIVMELMIDACLAAERSHQVDYLQVSVRVFKPLQRKLHKQLRRKKEGRDGDRTPRRLRKLNSEISKVLASWSGDGVPQAGGCTFPINPELDDTRRTQDPRFREDASLYEWRRPLSADEDEIRLVLPNPLPTGRLGVLGVCATCGACEARAARDAGLVQLRALEQQVAAMRVDLGLPAADFADDSTGGEGQLISGNVTVAAPLAAVSRQQLLSAVPVPMEQHKLWPVRVGVGKVEMPEAYHDSLVDIVVTRYKKYLAKSRKREPDLSLEQVNNGFFDEQLKSDAELEEHGSQAWPELYHTKEYITLRNVIHKMSIDQANLISKVSKDELESATFTMWVAVYLAGTPHLYHVHESAIVSGSYYASADDGASPIIFADPRGAQPMHIDTIQPEFEPEAPFARNYHFFPSKGDIVIFPSWLPHRVPPHPASVQPRVAFAFNLEVHGDQSWLSTTF